MNLAMDRTHTGMHLAGPGSHTSGALLRDSLTDSPDALTPDFEALAGALQLASQQRQAAGVAAADGINQHMQVHMSIHASNGLS